MQFKFQKTEGDHGLPVIPEVPSFPIAQVEGRNGIGKTLALRLLELVTGTQPYLTRVNAWRSLRSNLGDVTVTADNGDPAGVIEWHLTPSTWPTNPEVVQDWIGTTRIGGQPATIADVAAMLSFERLSGDEDLVETIARAIDRDRELTRLAQQSYLARAHPLDELLTRVAHLLDAARADELPKLRSDLSEAQAELRRRLEALNVALGLAQPYEYAARTQSLLAQVESAVPSLDAEIENLASRLAELRQKISNVEAEIDSTRRLAERESDLATRIERAQARVLKQTETVERTRVLVNELAQGLGLDEAADVTGEIELARRQLEALDATVRDIELGPRVRDVTDQLEHVLAAASADGLGQQVVARFDDGRETKVDQLKAAVAERAQEISLVPATPETAHIADRIGEIQSRLIRLRDLRAKFDAMASAAATLDRSEQALAKLVQGMSGQAAENFKRLTADLERLRRDHSNASVRRAVLLRQRAELGQGRTVEDLRAELRAAEGRLGVRGDQLEARLSELAEHEQALQSEVRSARTQTETAQRALASSVAALNAVAHALSADDFRFLRNAFPDEMPSATDGDDVRNATRILEFQKRVEAVRSSLQALGTGLLPALIGGLQTLADTVRNKPSTVITESLNEALRHRYELEFSQHLSAPEVASALFDSGQFQRLNLAEVTVSWLDGETQLHTRPLEAFSSGERAFAYTLARLQRARTTTAHRVVALDEFGAFVDRDRFAQLVQFIGKRVLNQTADQVIVVLPLRPETERSLTVAQRHELQERNYVSRELRPA